VAEITIKKMAAQMEHDAVTIRVKALEKEVASAEGDMFDMKT